LVNSSVGYGKKRLHLLKKALNTLNLDKNVNRFNKSQFFYAKVGFEIKKKKIFPLVNTL